MLPELKDVKLQDLNFATAWQTVIFRNYGYVPTKRIAKILKTDTKTVKREANRLGLKDIEFNAEFLEKGYITIIRNNWFLLPYNQIQALLEFDDQKFEFIIKEEDFLWVKLGNVKPICEEVVYSPLTESQIEQTRKAKKIVKKYIKNDFKYFGFFDNLTTIEKANNSDKGTRLIHGYITPCGDVFMEDSNGYLSDELLSVYSANGINAIFIHGILPSLSPYPFKPALAKGYEKRRDELRSLTERADKFGIKIYLYMNEPRSLPTADFESFPNLKGHTEDGYTALCFEQKEVQEYLYNAVKDLAISVPKLGGIMTITMSENLTHCNSKWEDNCPVCKNIPQEQSAAKVNNVIMKALKDAGNGAELIANLWGWSKFMGWADSQLEKGIKLLDKDISILTVSEYDLIIKKGGVSNTIIDYSISNPGPSKIAKKTLMLAKKLGHKTFAKIQTSNSWELSAVPYIPAFDLINEHISNLMKNGVENFMLSWTLGGYPSPSLDVVNATCRGESMDIWYKAQYGKNADKVKLAVGEYCKGFKQYPFDVNALYFSPKNLGSANLWSLQPENRQSAMVCYSFDDYENWVGIYGYEIYVKQMKKMLNSLKKAIAILESIEDKSDKKLAELLLYTKVSYIHFNSDLLQTQFSYLKRDLEGNKKAIASILRKEKVMAKELLECAYLDTKIGYEASNHYFYTQSNLLEKLVNIEKMLAELK